MGDNEQLILLLFLLMSVVEEQQSQNRNLTKSCPIQKNSSFSKNLFGSYSTPRKVNEEHQNCVEVQTQQTNEQITPHNSQINSQEISLKSQHNIPPPRDSPLLPPSIPLSQKEQIVQTSSLSNENRYQDSILCSPGMSPVPSRTSRRMTALFSQEERILIFDDRRSSHLDPDPDPEILLSEKCIEFSSASHYSTDSLTTSSSSHTPSITPLTLSKTKNTNSLISLPSTLDSPVTSIKSSTSAQGNVVRIRSSSDSQKMEDEEEECVGGPKSSTLDQKKSTTPIIILHLPPHHSSPSTMYTSTRLSSFDPPIIQLPIDERGKQMLSVGPEISKDKVEGMNMNEKEGHLNLRRSLNHEFGNEEKKRTMGRRQTIDGKCSSGGLKEKNQENKKTEDDNRRRTLLITKENSKFPQIKMNLNPLVGSPKFRDPKRGSQSDMKRNSEMAISELEIESTQSNESIILTVESKFNKNTSEESTSDWEHSTSSGGGGGGNGGRSVPLERRKLNQESESSSSKSPLIRFFSKDTKSPKSDIHSGSVVQFSPEVQEKGVVVIIDNEVSSSSTPSPSPSSQRKRKTKNSNSQPNKEHEIINHRTTSERSSSRPNEPTSRSKTIFTRFVTRNNSMRLDLTLTPRMASQKSFLQPEEKSEKSFSRHVKPSTSRTNSHRTYLRPPSDDKMEFDQNLSPRGPSRKSFFHSESYFPRRKAKTFEESELPNKSVPITPFTPSQMERLVFHFISFSIHPSSHQISSLSQLIGREGNGGCHITPAMLGMWFQSLRMQVLPKTQINEDIPLFDVFVRFGKTYNWRLCQSQIELLVAYFLSTSIAPIQTKMMELHTYLTTSAVATEAAGRVSTNMVHLWFQMLRRELDLAEENIPFYQIILGRESRVLVTSLAAFAASPI
jgi:hypothetical protein